MESFYPQPSRPRQAHGNCSIKLAFRSGDCLKDTPASVATSSDAPASPEVPLTAPTANIAICISVSMLIPHLSCHDQRISVQSVPLPQSKHPQGHRYLSKTRHPSHADQFAVRASFWLRTGRNVRELYFLTHQPHSFALLSAFIKIDRIDLCWWLSNRNRETAVACNSKLFPKSITSQHLGYPRQTLFVY